MTRVCQGNTFPDHKESESYDMKCLAIKSEGLREDKVNIANNEHFD